MDLIKSIKEILNQEYLSEILSTATYGSFWCDCSVHKDTPDDVYNKAKEIYECREDIWAYCLLNGGYLNICDVETCEEEGEEGEHKVGLDDIVKGFDIVMLNEPNIYAAIRGDNYDLYDADAVIQCAVFGDIIYA